MPQEYTKGNSLFVSLVVVNYQLRLVISPYVLPLSFQRVDLRFQIVLLFLLQTDA